MKLRSFRSQLQTTHSFLGLALVVGLVLLAVFANAQESAAPQDSKSKGNPAARSSGPNYSGMYSFLKDGEFLQVTVEDGGTVTGYVSRFGDGESDKGAFLDQFFKNGKLDGNKLTFTTEIVHGVAFDFRGNFERGEGKNPGDESFYILKGTLTENVTDVSKKVTSHSREVIFKSFPQEAGPASEPRK
ncbi:MAG TPA: hypothetical protein VMP68_23405 [Candidatus Eisenbacteria bacterium]|nr:hypothetical protein [Candidatus Eisenbacteria bacterium]